MNIGVIILRRTRPDLKRGFRVPFVPVFPIIGALMCVYLMRYLDRDTWIRFAVWLAIGFVIYFLYGRRHSRLRQGEVDQSRGGARSGAGPDAGGRRLATPARGCRCAC